LYILIFRCFGMRWKTKDFGLNDNKHSLNLIYSLFHHDCQYSYVSLLLLSSELISFSSLFQLSHLNCSNFQNFKAFIDKLCWHLVPDTLFF
jgi:hypothetical protein